MAKLKEIHKLYIVQQLASFRTPQEIVDSVKDLYKIEMERSQVVNYDPSKPYFKGAAKWKTIFNDAREKYLKNVNDIPIANTSYRIEIYQDLYEAEKRKPEKLRNKELILKLAEQAAKDTGGMFTNRRQIEGNITLTPNRIVEEATKLANANGTTVKEEVEWLLENNPAIPEITAEELKTQYLH